MVFFQKVHDTGEKTGLRIPGPCLRSDRLFSHLLWFFQDMIFQEETQYIPVRFWSLSYRCE